MDMELPVGTHHYMFIVDGQWTLDPSNPLVSVHLQHTFAAYTYCMAGLASIAGDCAALTFVCRVQFRTLNLASECMLA